MAFSHDQIVVATRAWIEATRREWVRRFPNDVPPAPVWEQLSAVDRRSFMVGINAALNAADPDNVKRVLERDAEANRS